MSTPHSQGTDPIHRHEAIYRRLLLLYPADFRRSHGELMAQFFRDQFRDALERPTRWSLVALWRLTLWDTGKAASREHLASLRKRLSLEPLKPQPRITLMTQSKNPRRAVSWWLVPIGILGGIAIASVLALRKPDEFRATSVVSTAPKLVISSQGPTEINSSQSVESTLASITNVIVLRMALATIQEVRGTEVELTRPTVSAYAGTGGTFIMSVTSTNFDYAREFAIAWANEFVEFKKQERRGLINSTQAMIDMKLLEFETKLHLAQVELIDFQKRNGITSIEDAGGSIQRQLDEAKAEYRALKGELEEAEGSTAAQLAYSVSGNRWFDLNLEVKRAENRLEVSPDDVALKAELALRQADRKSFLDLTEETRSAKIASLRRKVDNYPRLIEELTTTLFNTTSVRADLTRFKEEQQRMQAQVQDLEQQRVSVNRLTVEEQFAILQRGMGNSNPVGPDRPYLLVIGMVSGALAGLLLVGLRFLFRGPRDPGNPSALAPASPAVAHG